MPKEANYSVPISAFGRLAVKNNTSIDNSGRGMPVNTRSMQRPSNTPQGPPGQVRPGVSRGTPQYSISQSAMNTVGTSNDNVESSDEDTDDDEDSEQEGDAGNDGNDGSDAESDDSDDEDDPEGEVRKIFAIAEPSGLVPSELEDDEPGMNEAS
jgi:TATA-binding protein-associated factor Taf7